MIKIGIVNVSDRASQGIYEDVPGKEVKRVLNEYLTSKWEPVYAVVPDEQDQLEELDEEERQHKESKEKQQQEDLLFDYLPFCETISMPTQLPKIPSCRDVFDEPFLFFIIYILEWCKKINRN